MSKTKSANGTLSAAPQLMTTREVAQFLNVTSNTVRTWSHQGVLPAIRIGKTCYRFRRDAVEQLIAGTGEQSAA